MLKVGFEWMGYEGKVKVLLAATYRWQPPAPLNFLFLFLFFAVMDWKMGFLELSTAKQVFPALSLPLLVSGEHSDELFIWLCFWILEYEIKFTFSKCAIRYFFVFSHNYASITISQLQNIFIFPKEILYLLAVTPFAAFPLTFPRQSLTYFLSLRTCLFWTFPTTWIIQFVALCVWLLSLGLIFSGAIHFVVYVNYSFLFIAE